MIVFLSPSVKANLLTSSSPRITRSTATTADAEEQPQSSKRRISRGVRHYYRKLEKDEAALEEARQFSSSISDEGRRTLIDRETDRAPPSRKFCCRRMLHLSVPTAYTRLSLSFNVFLFFIKMAAAIQSGSLSVISSLVDSTLDLFSSVVITVTSYLMRHYNPFDYPIGCTRLEPVTILITASVMGTATLQVFTTSIEDIASGDANPHINGFSGTIIAITILMKGALFLICRRVDNPSVKTLAVDHINDVISNLVALLFGLMGTFWYNNLDPIGAALVAVLIIRNWAAVGYEQLKNLVGHRADRRFLSKITCIVAEHNTKILKVDTVRAHSFGVDYQVEVDIVLDPTIPLNEAHNVGESLQLKLKSLDGVERAFVNLYCHSPSSEHIQPSGD